MSYSSSMFVLFLNRARKELRNTLRLARLYWRNRTYLKGLVRCGTPLKMELGQSGKRPSMGGWTTINMAGDGDLCLDLSRPWPFADNSVEAIYSSHFLEHFSYGQLMGHVLKESRRVLKPGCTFGACVPDAEIFINYYQDQDIDDVSQFCDYKPAYHDVSKLDVINYIAYMNGRHKHMFDRRGFVSLLTKAGFRNAKKREFDPAIDREDRKSNSIYAECIK